MAGPSPPVDGTARLKGHPVEGKVDLPDEGRDPLHHRVGHVQDHPGVLPHDPGVGGQDEDQRVRVKQQAQSPSSRGAGSSPS